MSQTQTEIEGIYARSNIRKKVIEDIHPDSPVLAEMVRYINEYRDKPYGYESKQKRVNALSMASEDIALELIILVLCIKGACPIQSIVAQLGVRMGYEAHLDGVKTAAEIIACVENSQAYSIVHAQNVDNELGTMSIVPNYALEQETQDFIANTKYLPPMIEPPIDWTDNTDGGNLTQHKSVILGSLNHHTGHQALDVINILQALPWELNEMLEFQEVPNSELDTVGKELQFGNHRNQSTRVYQELIDNGNRFHFVWNFDKRGRSYSQGYHCNLQATEYKKAILSFANKELVV